MSIEKEDPRRDFLVDALTLGLFASANMVGLMQPVFALGGLPSRLAEGQSIYRLRGDVTVNGESASKDTRIDANAFIKTGSNSRIIFVVGMDAFILRSNSELQIEGSGLLVRGIRVLTGKILSVFGKRQTGLSIATHNATIGIRGTGIYVESEPDLSYVCTCYGRTSISANADPNIVQEVETVYHDTPFYVLPAASGNKLIQPAPVINHTDTELAMIEALVGREVPFPYPAAGYGLSKREGGGGY